MSGPLGSSQWMYASGEDYTIDQSLRFEDGGSAGLTFTPDSTTGNDKFVFSAWVKRGNLGTSQTLICANTSDDDLNLLRFDTNDNLFWYGKVSGSAVMNTVTSGVFRDCSSWYHIVLAYDSAQDAGADRVSLYVNGVLQDMSPVEHPSENRVTLFNTDTKPVMVGYNHDSGSPTNFFDGYMAEVHFIDDLSFFSDESATANSAFNINSFGETGTYGEWKPKEYSGTYGTNGFYLPFKADYTVEGFSTTLYKGTGGTTTPYIGGVGFSPSLLWLKNRNANNNGHHFLWDAVRGVGVTKALRTNLDNGEGMPNHSYDHLSSFETDGFNIGRGAYSAVYINSSAPHVAWSWDMGGDSYGIPEALTANGNVQHSTTQSKIGSSSIYFDGSGDKLTMSSYPSDFLFSGDFTYEFWAYITSDSSDQAVFGNNENGSGTPCQFGFRDDNTIMVYMNGSSTWSMASNLGSSVSWATNTWNHWALVRHNNTITLYKDGTSVATTTSDETQTLQGSSTFTIGDSQNYLPFTGYLDGIRISNKGRYTSNFTAPTTAFSNDANTLLLIHSDTSNGSTTFTDSSGATPNTDGSITSHVAANTTYGQSIVSYSGTGSSATVGHGLSSAPEMIIVKRRNSGSSSWVVGHQNAQASDPWDGQLYLDSNGAWSNNSGSFNDTAPTSDVFSINTDQTINNGSGTYIAYCFHSVTGYSSIGSYTGTGSATAINVTTGFEPAWLLLRVADASSNRDWYIYDNVRGEDKYLSPNTDVNPAEVTDSTPDIAFTSTGFTVTTTNDEVNSSGDTTIYMAFTDKREYAYWLDQSGNNNDWTSKGLTESDISVDSPTNNFATLNPLDRHSNNVLSEGNLKTVNTSGGGHYPIFANMAFKTGKWYAEFRRADGNNWKAAIMGIEHDGGSLSVDSTVGNNTSDVNKVGYGINVNTGNKTHDSTNASYGSEIGSILMWAFDADNGKIWWGEDGTWFASGDPAAGSNEAFSSIDTDTLWTLCFHTYSGHNLIANFGQDSSFAGTDTAQGNQDSNEIGDFYYTPPTDFLALCTSNLPDIDITPSEHFNTIVYDDGAGAKTGVGFQPDLVWLKSRGGVLHNRLTDVVRGVTKATTISDTAIEATHTDGLTAFGADGFTVGTDSEYSDQTGDGMVAWNWKAGGSGSANTVGSSASTVSVNTDAGFSIAKYTGTGSTATVGHGLSKAPEWIIIRNLDTLAGTLVYYNAGGPMDETDGLYMHSTLAKLDAATFFNDTAASSTVFTIESHSNCNTNTDDYIAYCFHSVDGYSKVGYYEGNSNADGTYVYLGFTPALIITKSADSGEPWMIHDSKRDPYNQASTYLQANSSGVEVGSPNSDYKLDFLSNGFKLRYNTGAMNQNTIVYYAVAETPFKYANAR